MFRRTVGEDLELRQFTSPDAPVIFAAVERNREHLRQWLPWVDQTRSAENVRQFISRATAQLEEGLGPSAGIWLKEVLIGSIGCHPFDLANRSSSIGYWIAAGHQGKGTITRCCVSLIDYLFEEDGMHRVEIRCGTGNVRSGAIPRRLRFKQEGVLREAQWVNDRWVDLEIWSMLQPDWSKRE